MTPPDRAALFEALAEMCRRYPSWRFGQLVSNLSGWADVDVWEVEDEQLLAATRAHLGAASGVGWVETQPTREQPAPVQDAIAAVTPDQIVDDRAWDVAFTRSQNQLARLAEKAREEIAAGRTRDLRPHGR